MSKYLNKLQRILVLTPDGIGSTFFQRTLTLYLNLQGIPTKNYHDLAAFFPNVNTLVNTLTTASTSTVARVSPYRSERFEANKLSYFKFCNMFFNDIFVIDRCPFESALSYCNTHINNGDLNVYNKQDYLKNTVAPYSIPIPYFIQSLKYFEDFYLWVDKYFPTVRKVSYSDLVYDTDSTFDNLLNLPSSTISITNFNKFNFLKVRDSDISKFSKEDLVNIITINDCANALLANNLYHENTSIPIKKITLAEKLARITNFNELLDTYNTYPSNHFTNISKNELDSRIEKEQNFWIT